MAADDFDGRFGGRGNWIRNLSETIARHIGEEIDSQADDVAGVGAYRSAVESLTLELARVREQKDAMRLASMRQADTITDLKNELRELRELRDSAETMADKLRSILISMMEREGDDDDDLKHLDLRGVGDS